MSAQDATSANPWSAGAFDCFSNRRLCCLACCVPCYVVGKNAEGLGEDCMTYGLLACLGLNFSPIIRWRLRQEKNIEGSMLLDVLYSTVIPCCAVIQEAKEIGWANKPAANSVQDMDRGGTSRDEKAEPEMERA